MHQFCIHSGCLRRLLLLMPFAVLPASPLAIQHLQNPPSRTANGQQMPQQMQQQMQQQMGFHNSDPNSQAPGPTTQYANQQNQQSQYSVNSQYPSADASNQYPYGGPSGPAGQYSYGGPNGPAEHYAYGGPSGPTGPYPHMQYSDTQQPNSPYPNPGSQGPNSYGGGQYAQPGGGQQHGGGGGTPDGVTMKKVASFQQRVMSMWRNPNRRPKRGAAADFKMPPPDVVESQPAMTGPQSTGNFRVAGWMEKIRRNWKGQDPTQWQLPPPEGALKSDSVDFNGVPKDPEAIEAAQSASNNPNHPPPMEQMAPGPGASEPPSSPSKYNVQLPSTHDTPA